MARTEKIFLSFPSDLRYLDALQGVAEALATVAGFGDEGRLDVGLAVREGAINAMKHGNQLDPSVQVKVEIRVNETALMIAIQDRGDGFEPETTPDPTLPENLWRTSGRGLLLMRSLVDEVSYVRHKGGMELRLSKQLPGQDQEAS